MREQRVHSNFRPDRNFAHITPSSNGKDYAKLEFYKRYNSSVETLKSLGLTEVFNWSSSLNEYTEWVLLSTVDLSCSECSYLSVLITKNFQGDFPGNYRILCINCFKLKDYPELSLEQQHVLADRNKLFVDIGLDIIAEAFGNFILNTSQTGQKNTTKEVKFSKTDLDIKSRENVNSPFKKSIVRKNNSDNETTFHKGEDDGAIPPGYRSVAWIRSYEAHAIKHSFETKSNHKIKNDSGDVIFECIYFPDNSFEVRKFKSNVQAVRINGENRRVVGWIRREEAKAVIESDEKRVDIEFGHIKAGNGGLIQFFPEHLEVVKKYRSTTRLLRKD